MQHQQIQITVDDEEEEDEDVPYATMMDGHYMYQQLSSRTSEHNNDFSPQHSASISLLSNSSIPPSSNTQMLPDIHVRPGTDLQGRQGRRSIVESSNDIPDGYGKPKDAIGNPFNDLPGRQGRRSIVESSNDIPHGYGKPKDAIGNPFNIDYIKYASDAPTQYQPRNSRRPEETKAESGSRRRSRKSCSKERKRSKSQEALPRLDAKKKPDTTTRKAIFGPMIRLGQKPVFKNDYDKNSNDDKSEISYFERMQRGRRRGRGQGRQGPPMLPGWDIARPLGPHTLDHLPEYSELVPQIKEYVDKFALHDIHNMPTSKLSDSESDYKVPKYMAIHGIEDLFELMTTSLVLKRPDNVLDYLIDFTAMLGTTIRNSNSASASASSHCHNPPTSSSHGQTSSGGQGHDARL